MHIRDFVPLKTGQSATETADYVLLTIPHWDNKASWQIQLQYQATPCVQRARWMNKVGAWLLQIASVSDKRT